MAVFSKTLAGVSVGCLCLASSAARADQWTFKFDGSSFSQMNQPAPSAAVALHVDAPAAFSGQFTSPDGLSTGIFTRDFGNPAQEVFPSYAQFQAMSDDPTTGTWSLRAQSAGATSQYHFNADFSAISPSSIPQVVLTTPAGTGTGPRPTIHWNLTGQALGTTVQVVNSNFTVNQTILLPGDFTSYTVPNDLPKGTYNLYLNASSARVSVPVQTTLLSGPDAGINAQGTFQFDSQAFETFTVATPGDADLNGVVNFDDYVAIDNGFNNHLAGWANGDFDGNGVVNFDDYVLIDQSFNNQTPSGGPGVRAVPEPGAVALSISCALLALRRRRGAVPGAQKSKRI